MAIVGEPGPEIPRDQLNCLSREFHGSPWRYCGTCSWVEPPPAGTAPLTDEERGRFAYHPATATTGPRHDAVRAASVAFAGELARLVPAGRHRSFALTAVQEAMMWANAAVACDTREDT